MIRSKFLSMDLQSQLRLPAAPTSGSGLLTGFSPPPSRSMEQQRELADEFSNWASGRIGGVESGSSIAAVPAISSVRAPHSMPAISEPWTIGRSDAVAAPAEDSVDQAGAMTRSAPDNGASPGPAAEIPSATASTPSSSIASESDASPSPARFHSSYRAMQVHDCYLIVETSEGVTVIDQHALHERIMYEHLRTRVLAGAVESQRLLVPQPIEVTSREAAILLEHGESLQRAGLGLEDFGNGTLIVTSYPAMLRKIDLQELVRDLIQKLEETGAAGVQTSTRRDILDELLHMMSCKAAVKAGQRLSQEEIESLLTQRHLVDDAHHCPHGRPTALSLSRMELDRQFGRLG